MPRSAAIVTVMPSSDRFRFPPSIRSLSMGAVAGEGFIYPRRAARLTPREADASSASNDNYYSILDILRYCRRAAGGECAGPEFSHARRLLVVAPLPASERRRANRDSPPHRRRRLTFTGMINGFRPRQAGALIGAELMQAPSLAGDSRSNLRFRIRRVSLTSAIE